MIIYAPAAGITTQNETRTGGNEGRKEKRMKKNIITTLTVIVALLTGFAAGRTTAQTQQSQLRIMTGNYYDYMVIETVDGNEWFMDEGAEPFEEGELVQVVFGTKGTENILDDEILEIRSIDSRY